MLKENILRLVNRNDLSITGVEKVISFSPNEVNLMALDCEIKIIGKELQTIKLDEENGDLVLSGVIDSIKWSNKKEKQRRPWLQQKGCAPLLCGY